MLTRYGLHVNFSYKSYFTDKINNLLLHYFFLKLQLIPYRINASVNPSECNGNATLNNMKLVHWPLMGELLHLVRR